MLDANWLWLICPACMLVGGALLIVLSAFVQSSHESRREEQRELFRGTPRKE